MPSIMVTLAAVLMVPGAREDFAVQGEMPVGLRSHRADWLAEGSFGLMVHYLIAPAGDTEEARTAEFNRIVEGFRLEDFIGQFASTGADWLIFTIGQNTGYYCSPNEYLDARLPGHTSRRDLILEIAARVHDLGKRFIAYLPAEVSWQSEEVQKAFCWEPADPAKSRFQACYQEFIRAYAVKLGRLCDGWWFDGCYEWEVFHNSHYDWPAWIAAARAGNPDAIVAFNDGSFCIGKIRPVTPLEDYLSGEVHDLVNGMILLGKGADARPYLPETRFVDGVQWHALVPVDSAFDGGPARRYSDAELFRFVAACRRVGGAVTINLPIGLDGLIPEESLAQLRRLGEFLRAGVRDR